LPDVLTKANFTIPADIVQKNAGKDAVKKLNAEFQMAGGIVSFKTTKKGQSVQLSHSDPEYLENFRVRLFKECGLPLEEVKTKGRKRKSDGKGDAPQEKTGDAVSEPATEVAPGRGAKVAGEVKGPGRPTPSDSMPEKDQMDQGTKNSIDEIIMHAIEDGAIDDGQIIKYAYNHDIKESAIATLRKRLWSGKCRNREASCNYRRKQMRFEEVMKTCCGVKKKCEFQGSDFCKFFDKWYKNVTEMFEEFKDKDVVVVGKISSAKFIDRENEKNHYKLLIYDTMVKLKEKSKKKSAKPKETRKLWAKVFEEDFLKFNKKATLKLDDIVQIEGRIVWNDYFFDYWIVDITKITIVESKGDTPIRP
jgi:hypothetical protein